MRRFPRPVSPFVPVVTFGLVLASVFAPRAASAQSGEILGTVSEALGGAVSGAQISLLESRFVTLSGSDGAFRLADVPAGSYTLRAYRLGYRPVELAVEISSGETLSLDITFELQPISQTEIIVTGAARHPQRIVEAPAAVSVVDEGEANDLSLTGQVPQVLKRMPGVDVVQSGVNDFNVNSRGFNASLTRRVLVLQDGRDLAIAFLGAQEWSAMSMPLEDMERIEMVRGPSSALFGPNAFSGVLNMVTPPPRQIVGTKLTLGGGGLNTLRGDLRHAGVSSNYKVGYKVNFGFYSGDTWSRSRTNFGDLEREYADAIGSDDLVNTPPPGFELRPLQGQETEGPPGTPSASTGDREDLLNLYGSARVDLYADDGSVFTAEAGAARVENQTFVTEIGRIQILDAWRPWARLAWDKPGFNVMAYYSGRISGDQFSLASGEPIQEVSHILHAEGQLNRVIDDRGTRIVAGGSARNTYVSTDNSILPPEDDDRNDQMYSMFGQIDFPITAMWSIVAAGRFDAGNLFDSQVSPKLALVFEPTPDQQVHLGYGRAFQTGSTLEYFLSVAVGPPLDLTGLEAGLRADPQLGPALDGVPEGELFGNSAAVPALGLGNRNLGVENVNSIELGYKGRIADRVFLTADVFYNKITNFITELLPGVNPTYQPWTAPDGVAEGAKPIVEQIVLETFGGGLTRLQDGGDAFVLSIGNANDAEQYGLELGTEVQVADRVQVGGSYTYFHTTVSIDEGFSGGALLANTPKHKGSLFSSYDNPRGLRAAVSVRLVDRYDWASGIYAGPIPSAQSVDARVSYPVTPALRFRVVATNLFDQQRYQIYGGSVIGRRILGGLTYTF
ncbi:MAG: TonB-dependent receptor domain-containing protein [Gemmatimonadota bacterium]